jgi:hypothetical protein
MKKASDVNEFRTPDLYMASYLQVAGLEMKRTEREGNRVHFVFDTSVGDIEGLKAAWFNNTGKVAAQPYSHAVKSLKSLVHMG